MNPGTAPEGWEAGTGREGWPCTGHRSGPEAPWGDHGPDGITARRLAELLAEYDIRSANIRFGEPIGQAKGYRRADFTDARARCCPIPEGEASQPSPPSSQAGRPEAEGMDRLRGASAGPATPADDEDQDDDDDGTAGELAPAS